MQPALTPNAWLRWDVIGRELRTLPSDARILELGMGGGAFGARFSHGHAYSGVEPDDLSRAQAQERLDPSARVLTDLAHCPPDERFDVVCAFEVLEHIDDDDGALEEWVARLTPQGHLWLSVPAHQDRFGAWDHAVGHLRRYSRDGLAHRLEAAGLEVVKIDNVGFPLVNLLEALRNLVARRRARSALSVEERTASSGRAFQPPDGVAPILAVLMAPARLLQRPFRRGGLGPGWVAVARRRPT